MSHRLAVTGGDRPSSRQVPDSAGRWRTSLSQGAGRGRPIGACSRISSTLLGVSILILGLAPLDAKGPYTPSRTPWGDPQLSGVYSNDDETGVPFERPAQFEGRRIEDITSAGARAS